MHALILAGGKGSRLAPITDTRPKPLVPFMGAPFAVGMLHRLIAAGCTQATFLVGPSDVPFAPLRTLGARLGIAVDFFTEETPLDTAGAVRRVLRDAEDPVLVCNGDILTDLDFGALTTAHDVAGAVATIALTRVDDPSAFGVVVTDDDGRVISFVEKPPPGEAPADTVNAGTYVLDPALFSIFPGDGPLSFEREVFPTLLEGGAVLHGAALDAYWSDMGTPDRLRAGHAAVLAGACRWPEVADLARRGPDAGVDATAEVAPDAIVDGGSLVGAGASVGAGARVHGSLLMAGVAVGADAVVTDAIVGEGVRIGPRAVVGSDAVLGDGARVAGAAEVAAGARVPPGTVIAHVPA